MPDSKRKAVVLGDFSPPTVAVQYIADVARRFADEVTLVVDAHRQDTITAPQRAAWLKELFPDTAVRVITSSDWHKSDPADFSEELTKGVRRILGKKGLLFSLEAQRAGALAAQLGVTYVPLDLGGIALASVSEAAVRKEPLAHWHALPECVRPYFVRRVCIFGPESTGKSTLAKRLAQHYQTLAVPEFAKAYIETMGRDIGSKDMVTIARGQIASEDAAAPLANRVLFCDSDPVTTYIWSGRLVGKVPAWLRQAADRRRYDLYIVTDIDVPYVDDVHRYIPKERQIFLDRCLLELQSRKRRFVQIKGGWDERFDAAVKAVDEMLSQPR
ncbi:MAG TPA: AAA family ATPase [Planktothrix sp.]|jgi:NadR type nicotinamide-nucleotide adenylyltransferase